MPPGAAAAASGAGAGAPARRESQQQAPSQQSATQAVKKEQPTAVQGAGAGSAKRPREHGSTALVAPAGRPAKAARVTEQGEVSSEKATDASGGGATGGGGGVAQVPRQGYR